jgi:ribosomal protein L37AE/L43A
MLDSGVRYSYCAYCIDRQEFYFVAGVWVCENCRRPLRRATQPTENTDKPLRVSDNRGTIVTGGSYG